MDKKVKKRIKVPPATRNYNRCVIRECIYHKRRSEIRVYKFPDDPAAVQIWCDLIQVPKSRLRTEPRVCGLHFELEDRHTLYCRVTSKPHNVEKCRCNIRDGVVPSLNLPQHKQQRSEPDAEQIASPEFINVKQEILEESTDNTDNMLHHDDMSTYDDIKPRALTSAYDDINVNTNNTRSHGAFDFSDVNMSTYDDVKPRSLMSTYDDINLNNNITASNVEQSPDVNNVIMQNPFVSSYDEVNVSNNTKASNDDKSHDVIMPRPVASSYDDVMPRPCVATYGDVSVNNNVTASNVDVNDAIMPCPLVASYDYVMEPQDDGVQDLQSMCRICAQRGEQMEAIFGPAQLHKKINFCLPNQVCESDGLPLYVCRSCVARLSISFELATQSQRADMKLRKLLQRQSNVQPEKKKKVNKRRKSAVRKTTQECRDDINISTPQQDTLLYPPSTPLCPPSTPNILQSPPIPIQFASGTSESTNYTVLSPLRQNSVRNSIGSHLSKNTSTNLLNDMLAPNSLNNVVYWPKNLSSNVSSSNNFELINKYNSLYNKSGCINPNQTFQASLSESTPQDETDSYNFSHLCKVDLETPDKTSWIEPLNPDISPENNCTRFKTAVEDSLQSKIKTHVTELCSSEISVETKVHTPKIPLANKAHASEITQENETLILSTTLEMKLASSEKKVEDEACRTFQEERLQSEIKVEMEQLQDTICDTFACDFCLKTFHTKQQKCEHMKQGHTFICILCNFSIHDTNQTIIDNHYIIKHCNPLVEKRATRKQNANFCNICIKSFRNVELYNIHICKERCRCLRCYKIISSARKNVHKCIPGEFKCEICKNISISKANLKIHIYDQHQLFLCSNADCFVIFKDKKTCMTHYAQVHKTRNITKYTCNYCGIVLTKPSLKQHILAKHNNHTFNCDFCDKKYMYKTKLFEHMYQHLGEKQFQCKLCTKRFYNKTVLGAHIKYKHSKCTHLCECGQVFSTKAALTSHIKFVHENSLVYHCKVCSAGFKTSAEVLEHFDIHEDADVRTKYYKISKYQCNICLKYLKNSMFLKLHKKRHIKVKNVVKCDSLICDICSKVCTSQTGLEIHVATHNKRLKFACNICDRKFATFLQMKAHHKFHFYLKNREYFCDGCGDKFKNKDILEKHVKQVCFPNRLFL